MNFTFAGVGFYVTGVKAPTSGIVSFIVDGGPVQTQNISSGNATIFWFRQMLLWQDNLTPATHTVLVNQSSPTGAGHLSLDTIIITRDSDLTGPSSSVPAPAGGTKTPSPNQPTVSTAPGSETGGSQVKGSGTNTGAIVGGVVAGVVALAAIGAAIFFWLRLRKVQSGAGAGERERPASEVRLAAYAPVSAWEPPLNSSVTFSPHTDYDQGPTGSTGSYAHSIGAASYGGYGAGSSTIGTTAAATSTAATPAWTTPNAPFVEKPTFGPPPYAHS